MDCPGTVCKTGSRDLMGLRNRRLQHRFDDAVKWQITSGINPPEWSIRFQDPPGCAFHAECSLCGHLSPELHARTVIVTHRCPATPAADPTWSAA